MAISANDDSIHKYIDAPLDNMKEIEDICIQNTVRDELLYTIRVDFVPIQYKLILHQSATTGKPILANE